VILWLGSYHTWLKEWGLIILPKKFGVIIGVILILGPFNRNHYSSYYKTSSYSFNSQEGGTLFTK